MKYLDNFSRRFVAVSLSIMGVMLCTTLMVWSIAPASANGIKSHNSSFFAEDFAGSESGDILMDYTSVHVPSQDKTYYECLVWDSKTGRSKLYFYSYANKKFQAYEDNVQMPAAPLE